MNLKEVLAENPGFMTQVHSLSGLDTAEKNHQNETYLETCLETSQIINVYKHLSFAAVAQVIEYK